MMKEQIAQMKQNALNEITNAKDAKELDEVRIKYLGKKGELTLTINLNIAITLLTLFSTLFQKKTS